MVDIGQNFLYCSQCGTSSLFDDLSDFTVPLMVFVLRAYIVTFAEVIELYSSLFFAIRNRGRFIFFFFLNEFDFWSRVLLACCILLRNLIWLCLVIDIHRELLLLGRRLKITYVLMIGFLTLNAMTWSTLKNALYFIRQTPVLRFSSRL